MIQKSNSHHSMRGAGIEYNKKKYITHTTLPFSLSAVRTFSQSQSFAIIFFILSLIVGLVFSPLVTLQLLVGFISLLYFIDTVFNLVLTLRSLHTPNEIYATKKELQNLNEKELPIYSILCPLYKEAHVIPQFLDAITKLDYPKDKLDVMLLLEEDDKESIVAINDMHLPFYFRTVVVPNSLPKTKPKACNYGLSFARGEYLVIFDAEDIPEPLQLKKALIGFKKVLPEVVCLQAKLNYYNTRYNLVTRFFTAEYSLWFDLTLTGLQSFNSTIPLGGTSNHFKTQVLRDLQGWDPFNVTEDADLGIRLFKKGFKTAIIDSTTYEEATSKWGNWLRQRSRWIKGYMQTYLVHMRTWRTFVKEKGHLHNFIFQLTVGGKLLFLLLNPVMWIITTGYFFAYPIFGPTLEIIYRPPISYLAVFSWIFGNFLFLYYYMLGCAKRNQWDLMKYIFMIPLYWSMMSTAAVMALYQLIFKPHYWEKTVHGFHLLKAQHPQLQSPVHVGKLAVLPVKHMTINSQHTQTQTLQKAVVVSHSKGSFSSLILRLMPIMVLLSIDFLFAKLFLPTTIAQQYVLLSFTGKIIAILAQAGGYIVNGLFSMQKKSTDRLYDLIFSVFLFQWIAFILFGIEGNITLPFLFGETFRSIIPYLSYYLFAMLCFSLAIVVSQHNAKRKKYAVTFVLFFILFLQGGVFMFTQATIQSIAVFSAYLGTIMLLTIIFFHSKQSFVSLLEKNIQNVLRVFKNSDSNKAWRKINE